MLIMRFMLGEAGISCSETHEISTQSPKNRLPMRTARQIAHVVQTSDRAHECDEWQPPTAVNDPIPNLPVFSDGVLCEK